MKILIIRLSSIGDILLSTAFIRQARQTFPDAEIDFIVKKRFSDLVQFNPHINHVFEYDDKSQTNLTEFVKLFKGQKYDYIFDLHHNLRSIYLRKKIAAQKRFHIKKDKLAQTALVKFKWRIYDRIKTIPERYSEVGNASGIIDDGLGLEVFWSKEIETEVTKKFREIEIDMSRPMIGLAPGAGFFTKRWPIEYFEQLINLINKENGYNILVIGGEDEFEQGNKLNNFPNVYNFAGKLNILESGAAISKLKCLISNDSGMMHMATSVQTPVVAIFGSSVQEFGFFPYRAKGVVIENENLACRPCSHIGKASCPKDHFKCMNDIHPEQVFNKMLKVI
jgi:lipopolysaccharide heptosyltransferase II